MDTMKIVAVFGVMFLFGLLVFILDRRKKKRCTMSVIGTVVDVLREEESGEDGNTSISYRPVFEYLAEGVSVRSELNFSKGSRRTYQVGQTRELRYNPRKKEEFVVVGESGGTGAGLFIMVIAAVLLITTAAVGM
ncbi:DUF3592 domain-containing protein [Lachnoclostridium sp. Marseille-P6806]|uniref:DUF3592 domain-containing protein n=1 Tax=Lachnoclostridium sp. Marseille-P6806 TaxID=2364793 RepID=UPI001030F2F7|nr:DUF3592 domain-containing protein [Lachnoclostridium sp. Marseille-P6806]